MSTSSFDFLVEEEAQVVPSSLDHLSRAELCHMIYRLDYERHTLKEKLVALRLAVSASNNLAIGSGGGGRRRAKQQSAPQLPPIPGSQSKKKSRSGDQNEKAAKRQKTNNNDNNEPMQQKQEPTPSEIDAIHKRLVQTIIAGIKSTTHGGLLKPRTTAEENDISLPTAKHIMRNWQDKLTHDTKRMSKWEFKSDDDIAKYLQCEEKYLSGEFYTMGKAYFSYKITTVLDTAETSPKKLSISDVVLRHSPREWR